MSNAAADNLFWEEIDQDTFKVMWELSAPGGEAEQCFMRLPQEEYYVDHRDTQLNWMPDVSSLFVPI